MDSITLYNTSQGWRWTRRNGDNNLIVGASTQAYESSEDAEHNIVSTQKQPYMLLLGDAAKEDQREE